MFCARCAAGGTTIPGSVSSQSLGASSSLTRAVGSEAEVPLGLAGHTPQPLLLGALLVKAAPIPGHPEPWPSECGARLHRDLCSEPHVGPGGFGMWS